MVIIYGAILSLGLFAIFSTLLDEKETVELGGEPYSTSQYFFMFLRFVWMVLIFIGLDKLGWVYIPTTALGVPLSALYLVGVFLLATGINALLIGAYVYYAVEKQKKKISNEK